MTSCALYVRQKIAYIPVLAKTEAGYHMNVEPVEVVDIDDGHAFALAFKRTISRGNPVIPTPTRATGFPKPVVPKYAKLKSWKEFEHGASYWTFEEKRGAYHIEKWKKGEERGWIPDPERMITFTTGTALDEAINQVVTIIQSNL